MSFWKLWVLKGFSVFFLFLKTGFLVSCTRVWVFEGFWTFSSFRVIVAGSSRCFQTVSFIKSHKTEYMPTEPCLRIFIVNSSALLSQNTSHRVVFGHRFRVAIASLLRRQCGCGSACMGTLTHAKCRALWNRDIDSRYLKFERQTINQIYF